MASAERAPGSIVARILPGSVVPPPRPARRDSRPAERASATSRARRILAASLVTTVRHLDIAGLRSVHLALVRFPRVPLQTVHFALCCLRRPDAAQTPLPRDHQHRPGRARRLPGGNSPSILGRGHPRAAARVRRAARALADDEGVRRRPRDDGAPADGDRALRDAGTRRRGRPGWCRAALRRARSCSGCSRSWGDGSGACRPRRTSTRTGAGCRRSRSTGTRSAR